MVFPNQNTQEGHIYIHGVCATPIQVLIMLVRGALGGHSYTTHVGVQAELARVWVLSCVSYAFDLCHFQNEISKGAGQLLSRWERRECCAA